MTKKISIRKIQIEDNQNIAKIIREVLTEFGGNKPGTAYHDYDTEHMFEAYQNKGQIYYVAEINEILVGGCGIKQLTSGENICELQKLYILSNARGQNIGKILLEKCMEFAKKANYLKCYLETFPNMHAAIHLYQKYGFDTLDSPIGNTGHNGCDIWMIKNL